MKLKNELTEEEQKRLVIAGTAMVVVFFFICLISIDFGLMILYLSTYLQAIG